MKLAVPAIIVLLAAALTLAAPEGTSVVPRDFKVATKTNLPPKPFTQQLAGTEGVTIDMVPVPGGAFKMGSPDSEPGHKPDEAPQHAVTVRPFWMGKTEVTWAQFYAFWKDQSLYVADGVPQEQGGPVPPADAITRPTNTYVLELYEHGRDGHPVLCMSHHAAMMYCHWLRFKTGLPYRLPTEAEWEFACRAGHAGAYGFDGGEDKLKDYAWYLGDSATSVDTDKSGEKALADEPTTHIVARKKANDYGLFDMHGNLWEWCLDTYKPDAYSLGGDANKPVLGGFVKPLANVKWGHVVRGGSYADKPEQLRSAARRQSEPVWVKDDPQAPTSVWWLTNMDVIGFRVCLPSEEYPELVGLKPTLVKKAEPSEVGIRKRK